MHQVLHQFLGTNGGEIVSHLWLTNGKALTMGSEFVNKFPKVQKFLNDFSMFNYKLKQICLENVKIDFILK